MNSVIEFIDKILKSTESGGTHQMQRSGVNSANLFNNNTNLANSSYVPDSGNLNPGFSNSGAVPVPRSNRNSNAVGIPQ
jgi:hypothetical protein